MNGRGFNILIKFSEFCLQITCFDNISKFGQIQNKFSNQNIHSRLFSIKFLFSISLG